MNRHPALSAAQRRDVARFAAGFRRTHGFVDRLTAVEMRNVTWREIYPVAIPGYADMPFETRSYRRYNFRRAAAAYLKRRRIKTRIHSPSRKPASQSCGLVAAPESCFFALGMHSPLRTFSITNVPNALSHEIPERGRKPSVGDCPDFR